MFFSSNTFVDVTNTITNIARIKANECLEKYIGIPTLIGKNKHFQFLLDRSWTKMSNWKTNFLSGAGKEILLKSMLQKIPTYTMFIFLLNKVITSQLNDLFQKFWWGYNEDSSNTHWINWSKLGISKDMGGLGFRNVQSFNMAFIAIQCLRILKEPSSLVSELLKQKYHPSFEFLEAKLGCHPSLVWRILMARRTLLESGLMWRIGNGKKVYNLER